MSLAFLGTSTEPFFFYAVIFSLSTFAGFLAFFMPSGLGVREAALIFFLNPEVGEANAIIIAIASRLWLIFGDLISFLLSNSVYFLQTYYNKRSSVE